MFRLPRKELRELIEAGAVFGTGSVNKTRRLRLSGAVAETAEERHRSARLSGGTKYTYRETQMANQPYTLKPGNSADTF